MDYTETLLNSTGNIDDILKQMMEEQLGECSNNARKSVMENGSLKKFKPEYDSTTHILIPQELAVPINLSTGKPDERYNNDNPFIFKCAISDAVTIMRKAAKDNEALRKYLNTTMSVDDAFYEFDNLDKRLSHDKVLKFKSAFGRTTLYAHAIHAVHFPSEGRDYAYKIRSNAQINESGQVIGDDILTKYSKLETKLGAHREKKLREEEKAKGTAADEIKLKCKELRKARFLSEPYVASVMQICVLQCDSSGIKDSEVKDIKSKKSVVSNMRWTRMKTDSLKKLDKMIGNPISDKYDDFLEVIWALGPEGQAQDARTTVEPVECGSDRMFCAPNTDGKIILDREILEEAYREYRNTEEKWSERQYLKLPDFREKPIEEIRSLMRTDISQYREELEQSDVIETFQDILADIGTAIVDSAITKASMGMLPSTDVSDIEKEVSADSVPEEDKEYTEEFKMSSGEDLSAALNIDDDDE